MNNITTDRYPVSIELPIQWGDLDAYGHVNNLAYLKWFEAARAVYAAEVGVSILPGQPGVGAVLATISCKYLRPLNYPGVVVSCVRVSRLAIGSVSLEFKIADRQTGVSFAEGHCDAVLVDNLTGKPVPVPDGIRAAVEEFEGRSFQRLDRKKTAT